MAIGIWDTIYNLYKSYTRTNSPRVEELKKETPLEKEASEIYNIPLQNVVVEDLKPPFSEESENSNAISQNEAVEEIVLDTSIKPESEEPNLPEQIEPVQEIEIEKPTVEETPISDLSPQIEPVQEIEMEKPTVEEIPVSDLSPQIESVQEIVIEKPTVEEIPVSDLSPQMEPVQEIVIEKPTVEETVTQEQQDLVTVEEEMNSVEKYLALEKERLGEKLNYSLDIEQDALNQKIPPIIIQTLAENAVKHGVQQTENGGYVHIQSFVYDGFLTIEIKNSGQLNNETVSFETSESGIYIENTIKRLASLFGENGFFSIENDGENEVVATVCVPMISC